MSQKIQVGIVGTGIYLPEKKITAEEISNSTNGVWTTEAVIEKLGIVTKLEANKDEGSQEMSYLAAIDCLKNTGVDPLDIDVILSITEEWKEFPLTTSALYVQGKIGANNAWGIDLQNRCCTSVSAIKVAKDRRLPSIYYSFDKSKSLNPKGRNILLGNSASVTQNHIDFIIQNRITLLKQSNKVICPISYGSKRYAKTLELIGKQLLPNRIEFIKVYVDYEMFIENLRSCSYAVFNNQRAQAMGTVLLCFKSET